ncbi:unnamed protein product [Arctogadus glacialis]
MDRKTLFSLWAPASIMMADRESYTEVTRLVPAPPTEAKPPGHNPRYPRGARLPWLAAPAGGSNERVVLRPPTEAKPPGLNPRYPRGARLPRLAVAEEADGQEAWIQAAHSDTVSPRARALGAASSQETSPGQTPPGEEVLEMEMKAEEGMEKEGRIFFLQMEMGKQEEMEKERRIFFLIVQQLEKMEKQEDREKKEKMEKQEEEKKEKMEKQEEDEKEEESQEQPLFSVVR